MALVACPDCQREVSDSAPTCPGCGRPLKDEAPTEAQGQFLSRDASLALLVTLLVAGARCIEIVTAADRLASALDKSVDYETSLKNLFFETAPPRLLGLTGAWVYGAAWLGLLVVVAAVSRARK